ncbi:sensor histidine kinase [Gracilibacillus alcaliphilus]|uniref:sensor histidine kinase n=1 Tax=Gracilibacillus alcaliphilus TaxID=1401441 RepID=UPI00195CD2CF|nr:sensor histidine kinase [Gracilibacillus alcaliphilus]MBM7676867.1 signal transduction histidine kinase [Gracilibacillus alcaliphilus]
MSFFLIVIIIFLLLVIGWKYMSMQKLKRELNEMHDKLSNIIEQESANKVLMQTNRPSIQQMLIQVNRLLSHNQKVVADNVRTKASMKKMLSNMSHDLKTPLTVILVYIEKLNKDKTISEEERYEIMTRLHEKILNVIGLMNKFFDLAKLESGDDDFPISRLSVNEICRKNVLEFYHLLQEKGLRVEVDIPEQDYFILGNENSLNRILSNLISNAIHYGSDGGVIGLTIREVGENIAIDIWDEGKGIAEPHQDRVFERLYTMDDARNPEFQGSGLGLSITKRLTEAMNGKIKLISQPYKKTVFTCIFKRITY